METAPMRSSVSPIKAAIPGAVAVLAVSLTAGLLASQPVGLPQPLADLPAVFWAMAALAVLIDVPQPRSPRVVPVGPHYGGPSLCFTFAILLTWGFVPALSVQLIGGVLAAWRAGHRVGWAVHTLLHHALALGAAHLVLRALPAAGFAYRHEPDWLDGLIAVVAALAWAVVWYGVVALRLRASAGRRWWQAFSHAIAYEALPTGALLLLGPVLAAGARTTWMVVPLAACSIFAVHKMAQMTSEHERMARLDPLTGLVNRKALAVEIAAQTVTHAQRSVDGEPDDRFALLLLDLNRFKNVNDALGHEVGDRLLVKVGARLAATVRPGDLVSRLGGDEFAILAVRLADAEQARRIAGEITAALAEPVWLDGLPLDVGGSIGIALFPEQGDDFATLMRHADVAMYEAKHRGDAVAVYAAESDQNSAERLSLLGDLRRALERPRQDEIKMYYQPQVEIATGEVVGVEALLRWHHPRRGLVNPEELIKVAEQSAVMRLLTRHIVDDVVEQLAKWAATGVHLRAAVNVSVRDLHTPEIAEQIAERMAQYGIPPDRLQVEITEGALMADPRRVLATIGRLDRIGVAIALDDFGTGYSSMQHLRRLPLSEVKVDRSFVLGMAAEDADDAAIVRSIIELSAALGLRVVAEGVEDERSWRLLHEAGCEVAQGWYFARPLPPDKLVDWLDRYQPMSPAAPPMQPPVPWPTRLAN